MPVPTTVQHEKNMWVAAGDGDLERVRELIEVHSLSPNAPDQYTYTPMHAAASYGQLEVLEYLISRGGDVNITDGDLDTPLYVVENVETAQFLVNHGAVVDRKNAEGVSPIEALEEDFPGVSAYLRTLDTSQGTAPAATLEQPSQYAQDVASESLTNTLLDSVRDVMQRAEAEGRTVPDEELREIVGRTVLEGVVAGYTLSGDSANGERPEGRDGDNAKRSRTDGS